MNGIAKIGSLVALMVVLVPCLLYMFGSLELSAVKIVVLIGTIVWFIATPMWMSRELDVDADQVEI